MSMSLDKMSRAATLSVRAALETYFEAKQAEYNAQPVERREPTLPFRQSSRNRQARRASGGAKGKLNVRELRIRAGIPDSREQLLFKRTELVDLINRHAAAQNLIGIEKMRRSDTASDSCPAAPPVEAASDESESIGDKVEAIMASLRARNRDLATQLISVTKERDRLREQLRFVWDNGFLPRIQPIRTGSRERQ